MSEQAYWMLLSQVDGIGYKTFHKILDILGTKNMTMRDFAVHCGVNEYEKDFNLSAESVAAFNAKRKTIDDIKALLDTLYEKEIMFLTLNDTGYPSLLKKHLRDSAPPILYMHGNMSLLHKRSIAVVGSRDAGEAHLKAARALAKELSVSGFNIISGYAKGIDTESHLGALEAGGSTVMVLSYGIGELKLKRSFNDGTEDAQDKILVVSEFPPTQKWSVHAAMTRNKTVCALSEAVVVVTASADGGTMDTARTALKMGKPLFAVSYGDNSLDSDGNKILLNEGLSACGNAQAGALPLKVAFEHDTVTVNVNDIEQHLSADVSHKEKQISLFA